MLRAGLAMHPDIGEPSTLQFTEYARFRKYPHFQRFAFATMEYQLVEALHPPVRRRIDKSALAWLARQPVVVQFREMLDRLAIFGIRHGQHKYTARFEQA